MLRFRRLLISLLSALAAAGLVYAVYMTLLHQVELQETTTVIVPGRFIQEGTVITEELLTHRTVLKAAVDSDMFNHADELIGRQTMIPLGVGEPILGWKLSERLLLPLEAESTFEIPQEYLRSISGGVREGDLVRIYVSGDGNERRLLLQDVRVASVRLADDSRGSREATERQDQTDQRQQLLAKRTARQVERINLNLTEDQWLLLDRASQPDGAKLVIALPGDQTVLDMLEEATVLSTTTADLSQKIEPEGMLEEAVKPEAAQADDQTPATISEATQTEDQTLPIDLTERDSTTEDEEGGENG